MKKFFIILGLFFIFSCVSPDTSQKTMVRNLF
jgi:hypothetical protein